MTGSILETVGAGREGGLEGGKEVLTKGLDRGKF